MKFNIHNYNQQEVLILSISKNSDIDHTIYTSNTLAFTNLRFLPSSSETKIREEEELRVTRRISRWWSVGKLKWNKINTHTW